jgi:hypothetical protein
MSKPKAGLGWRTHGWPPAAVLEVPLARPRKRLELATNPGYLKCRQRVLEFLYERHRFVEAA